MTYHSINKKIVEENISNEEIIYIFEEYYKENFIFNFELKTINKLIKQKKIFIFEYLFKNGHYYNTYFETDIENIDLIFICVTSGDFLFYQYRTLNFLKKLLKKYKDNENLLYIKNLFESKKIKKFNELHPLLKKQFIINLFSNVKYNKKLKLESFFENLENLSLIPFTIHVFQSSYFSDRLICIEFLNYLNHKNILNLVRKDILLGRFYELNYVQNYIENLLKNKQMQYYQIIMSIFDFCNHNEKINKEDIFNSDLFEEFILFIFSNISNLLINKIISNFLNDYVIKNKKEGIIFFSKVLSKINLKPSIFKSKKFILNKEFNSFQFEVSKEIFINSFFILSKNSINKKNMIKHIEKIDSEIHSIINFENF